MTISEKSLRSARENQRKQFIGVIAYILIELEGQEGGKAIKFLDGKVTLIRAKIKKFKTLFGPDQWKTASSEKILASIAQQALRSSEPGLFKFRPEILDWLYSHGYESEGESTKEISHVNIDTKDIPKSEEEDETPIL